MCLFKKRRRMDRIARQIAANHGLEADYHAARRARLSPIEALEDWDLLDEETLKALNTSTKR